MITINVSKEDLSGLRFAFSPLIEIPLSYRVYINPEFQGRYTDWVEEARRALYDVDLPYLSALVEPHGYIPDFLTQTPTGTTHTIRESLAAVLATPDDVIRDNMLEQIKQHGDSEIRRFYLAHPRDALQCLIEDLVIYWNRVLQPYWSRMMSVLEADMLFRARTLALDGPNALFPELHPTISYKPGEMHITPLCGHSSRDMSFSLAGNGLQLVPMVFSGCGRMYTVESAYADMLAYTVRGTGLWYHKPPNPGRTLELAVGAGRARVLESLLIPATTSEIAFKLHSSAGTISQHLMRLHKAGLVESRRSGKRVFYQLTERGQKLMALFDTEP